MKDFLKTLLNVIEGWGKPSGNYLRFQKGAKIGITLVIGGALFTAGYTFKIGLPPWIVGVGVLILGLFALRIVQALLGLLQVGIKLIPAFILTSLAGAFTFLFFLKMWRFGWPDSFYYLFFVVLIFLVVIVSGVFAELLDNTNRKNRLTLALGFSLLSSVAGIVFVFHWLLQTGDGERQLPIPVPNFEQLNVADPSISGIHDVEFVTYGSGNDERRDEYNSMVSWKTNSVDASLIIPEWKGSKAKWRKRYWKFDSKSFPLNGRLWIPKRDEKMPVVMIVHGNHTMEEYSDQGYGYLGELLASQGYLTVSIDENFINATWSGDFRGKEMPARAWLLLKHLQEFRKWNELPSHPLYNRVDLDNIILVGHSRGGEAVAIAASFNQLEFFPDDANLTFDFHYGIQGIISIAPTDKRYFRRIKLRDISYLSLQGSYDSDESSFFGVRQLQRIELSQGSEHFKAGLYIHRANHGQFNTEWGSYDSGAPFKWLLNVKPLLPADDQRKIAEVYIGAFIHDVFNKPIYQELFKSAYTAQNWLPRTLYFNQYVNGSNKPIVNFEEDIDLQSGTFEGSSAKTEGLVIWREEKTRFRDDDFRSTNAVVIGWDSLDNPQYNIRLNPPLSTNYANELLVSIATGDFKQLKLADSIMNNDRFKEQLVNFTLVIKYENSRPDSIVLSSMKMLNPALTIQYAKTKSLSSNWGSSWEPVFENYYFPIHENDSISSINFLFDQTPFGVIQIDQISIQHK